MAGKAGKLGDAVKIERSGSIVTVTAASGPKRYLKYLGKVRAPTMLAAAIARRW